MQQELSYPQGLLYLVEMAGAGTIFVGTLLTSIYHFSAKWAYKRLEPIKQIELGEPTLSYALKQTKKFFKSFANKKIDVEDRYTRALIEQIDREYQQRELGLERRF